jgi:hypothetical protein
MNVNDQVAFDAMKDNRDKLSEDVDKLKKNNEQLRDLLIKCRHKSYNIEAKNDKMKDISFWAVLTSFIVSYCVGFVIISAMCTQTDMSAKVCVSVGLWFSTWLTYYFTWRFENKSKYND